MEKRSTSFSEPFKLLWTTHRRIEDYLDVLKSVGDQLRDSIVDERLINTMQEGLKYFSIDPPIHTKDEEESVLPRLKNHSEDVSEELLQVISRLESEHAELAELQQQASDAAESVVQSLKTSSFEIADGMQDEIHEYCQTVSHLCELYKSHIEAEETQIVPKAKEVLTSQEIKEIGEEMAKRRELAVEDPPEVYLARHGYENI